MGNNASHSGNITPCPQLEQEQRWAHSYPRTPQRLNQHKVLPDVTIDVHHKLRPTNNGEILFNGGTISGRHQNGVPLTKEEVQNGVYKSSSLSSRHAQEHVPSKNGPQPRSFISHQRDPLHKSSPRKNFDMHHRYSQYSQRELQAKGFGSAPDLRESNNFVDPRDHVSKGRKKYKAPPPPQNNMPTDSDNWDPRVNGEVRKTRLFKTRGETKKKTSTQNYKDSYPNVTTVDIKNVRHRSKELKEDIKENKFDSRERSRTHEMKQRVPEMQRSKSMPDFQAELIEATQRLRTTKQTDFPSSEKYTFKDNQNRHSQEKETKEFKEQKLKTLDHNISKKEYLKYKMKHIEHQYDKDMHERASLDSKKDKHWEIVTKEFSSAEKTSKSKEAPSKMFYFGMDDAVQTNYDNNIVDNFASTLQMRCMAPQGYSGSDISSEVDGENGRTGNEISLHLRPILPKKQLETPRFSPAAAWRLLSTLEANPSSSTVSDEGPVFIEDRIEKLTRQPPPDSVPVAGSRSNHDKSGDSGISGDAGLPGFEENNEPVMINRNNNMQITSNYPHPRNLSWTPQQDLEGEEESSSEGEENRNRNSYVKNSAPPSFAPRPHVFSLSLPRDNQLAAYMEEKARLQTPISYSNLQKLKRSVSGVLGNINQPAPPAKPEETKPPANPQDQNSNWFLSRSAPNSLNNGFNSLDIHSQKHEEPMFGEIIPENSMPLVSLPVKNGSNCGRLMYLPEFETSENEYPRKSLGSQKESWNDKVNNNESCERIDVCDFGFKQYENSKSRENLVNTNNVTTAEPENLQDPPKIIEDKWKVRKPKKFTFQSTVRQIERRWLAEKLSREAERKEQQRLGELEAMQRVEEEFQRKRAKEKANIRQQLRLFSLDENLWNSGNQSNWDNKCNIPARSEPDGAVSSSASSPTLEDSSKSVEKKHLANEFLTGHIEPKGENYKKNKHIETRLSPVVKKASSHHSSESLDDSRFKAPTTQVLSEYRQSRREYKDYRASSRYLPESNESTHMSDPKQTTVHPQIIYNMPRALHGVQGSNTDSSSYSNNYRKDFAHGIILPSKSGGSTYSEDSQLNGKTQSSRTQFHIT